MRTEKFNLTEYLIKKNLGNLDKVALIYVQDRNIVWKYTYKEIIEKFEIVANYFKNKNFQKKDRILLRLHSDPNVIFLFFGIILADLVPIPVSRMLTVEEVEFIAKDSECKAIVYQELPIPNNLPASIEKILLEEVFSIKKNLELEFTTFKEDPAFVIYTSGTTGVPKGVIHAQRNILGRIPIQREWIGIQQDDILLHSGELNWTYTLGVGIMDVFANQATSILVGSIRKDPTIWTEIIKKYNISIFATVPSLYRRIIKYSEEDLKKISSIRHCLTAGEELHPELYKHWTSLVEKPLYEALGMTEISTYISSGPNVPTKIGSPGKPQKGRNIKIIHETENSTEELEVGEVGLIAVHKSDPGLMLGYYNRKEEEKEVFRGEWFIGGDLAYRDSDGYYWFMGRNNDLMKSFGYRVSPVEIEKVLNLHPFIAESAVCEIKKDQMISFITAFIVKKDGKELSGKEVIDFCKLHLAEYKCPKKVIFLKELPRNNSGKVSKNELKRIYNFNI